jgi:hypothetical protein
MDIQHRGDQLLLALGGLIYCSESKNVVFGIILEDGSISSDFRITASFDLCKHATS